MTTTRLAVPDKAIAHVVQEQGYMVADHDETRGGAA